MSGPVLVTGANGFVGRAVVDRLVADGVPVRAAVRGPAGRFGAATDVVEVGSIGPTNDWTPALQDINAVVHCAARVHQLRDQTGDPLAAFRAVNRDGTLTLARAAAAAGVRRFVFISSIGVNGAETHGTPFRAGDPAAPHSPYAVSKLEAEAGLQSIAVGTGMEVVVIRPPLVYGPGAPGNFGSLLRAVNRGWPLPFGAIHNRRSFIAIDNLVDLVVTTLRHTGPVDRTLLASDGDDLSTSDLLRRTALALGRPARLIPVPAPWIRRAVDALGRPELGQRLCGSLEIDISRTRAALDWTPPVSVDEALVRTAQHFLHQKAGAAEPRGDNQRR